MLRCLLLAQVLICICLAFHPYAMNKPHMIFQVSSREEVSINAGWFYWRDENKSFDSLRLKYKNEADGLYCVFTEHNGDTHFKEQVVDNIGLFSQIKYQSLNPNSWEAVISTSQYNGNNQNSTSEQQTSSSTNKTTFGSAIYVAIQNSDYQKVDKVGYSSPKQIQIVPTSNPSFVQLDIRTEGRLDKSIYIKSLSNTPFDKLALLGNISDTWNTYGYANQYLSIRSIAKYKSQPDPDPKIKAWQKSRVQEMKLGEFPRQDYVIVVVSVDGVDAQDIHIQLKQHNPDSTPKYSPFDSASFDQESRKLDMIFHDNENKPFLKHVLYNLLGGITYYYGPLYSQTSLLKQAQTFTHSTTPSRLIFPRCFLWDDGFHMTVLVNSHPHLVLEFLGQWINKIDLFGWIAREQIRGFESSAMMPDATFVYQDPFEGNPPTLFLPILQLLHRNPNYPGLRELLSSNMWKLEKWYRYFQTTQSHYDLTDQEELLQSTIKYRWRCKDSCQNGNFMGSGLDDFPRQDDNQLSKQHVDLICWLYFFADSLRQISQYLGIPKATRYYTEQSNAYNATLHEWYLDQEANMFKDVSVSKARNINQFVDHIGYISLFPFMMGMMHQHSAVFNKTVEVMQDPKLLWSEDGLRSLAYSDRLYGTGDNYWRGSVWMPINYLVLRACKLYYPASTQSLHDRLRANLIKTVQGNYQKSGYLYENYLDGKGNRGHPFYGWSSLINPIILDLY